MRAWLLVAVMTFGGCTNGSTNPKTVDTLIVDDTDDTDVGVDTDAPTDSDWDTSWADNETGQDSPETGNFQPNDTSATPPLDSNPFQDTALCPFGEVPDCDEICFPVYFIGDGTCDDGASFQSNFNCVQFSFDGGDCATDTGLIFDTDEGCIFEVVMHTAAWATESGWELRSASGRLVYEVFSGTYTANNRTYVHSVRLPPGDYTFIMLDAYGDGWHGGTFEFRNPHTGEVYATGGLTGNQARGEVDFTVDCDDVGPVDTDLIVTPTCGDVQVKLDTRQWGGEISWDIVDTTSTVLAAGSGYLSNTSYERTVRLGEGVFTFRKFDAFGDGWAGAQYTITNLVSGGLIARGTLEDGDFGVDPFSIACSSSYDPILDDTDAPRTGTSGTVTCDPIIMEFSLGDDGTEVGWQLIDDSGNVVDSRDAGFYQSNIAYYVDLDVPVGDYTLRITDAGGDGMEGGSVRIYDADSGTEFASTSDTGAWSTFDLEVEIECGASVDTDVHDTGTCADGTLEDCDGICWPATFVGDGFCDDGVLFAPNFMCADFNMDGNDCNLSP